MRTSMSRHLMIMVASVFLSVVATTQVCAQTSQPSTQPDAAPPAVPDKADSYPAGEHFNQDGSDPRAIALADKTMRAMGGWDAWQDSRVLQWTFFGMRHHIWDRETDNLRVTMQRRDNKPRLLVLMNLRTTQGRAWDGDVEITDPEELGKLLSNAHAAWINDSYWLLMPYKMKDDGVTLTMVGRKAAADGTMCDVVELTFEKVGRTPQNKYHVYIDAKTSLVVQWDFFRDAADDEPAISTPWLDWADHGGILLSGERGDIRGEPARLTDIAVYDAVPDSVFTDAADPALPDPKGR